MFGGMDVERRLALGGVEKDGKVGGESAVNGEKELAAAATLYLPCRPVGVVHLSLEMASEFAVQDFVPQASAMATYGTAGIAIALEFLG